MHIQVAAERRIQIGLSKYLSKTTKLFDVAEPLGGPGDGWTCVEELDMD